MITHIVSAKVNDAGDLMIGVTNEFMHNHPIDVEYFVIDGDQAMEFMQHLNIVPIKVELTLTVKEIQLS